MASTSELGSGAAQEQAKVSCRKRKRIRGSVFCPHWSETVSKTTYYRHRKTFYDRSSNKWNTDEGCMELQPTSDSESDRGAGLEDEALEPDMLDNATRTSAVATGTFI